MKPEYPLRAAASIFTKESKRMANNSLLRTTDIIRLGIVVIALLFSWSLSGRAGDRIDRQEWIERGEKTVAPFKQKLMGALAQGLEEGPETAIEVCQIRAPEIAAGVSSPGVKIGRTSHKLRNADNAPQEWMQPLLESYVKEGKSDPEVVPLDGGGVGYVEPIYMKRICLACHGGSIAPEVEARIKERYPEDKARGFEEGEFRGLFWVEFREPERKSR
jgi:hypothetical protein